MTHTTQDRPVVRLAEPGDLSALAGIEDAADGLFAERFGPTGWPPADSGADRAAEPGFILVAQTPATGEVVGFAHVLDLDGHWHLDQVAVHPDHGRRGIGSALLAACHAEVVARGGTQVTLRTFADVPWNAPFYARNGYAVLTGALPAHLLPMQRAEERLDLARHGPRVAMTWRVDDDRPVSASGPRAASGTAPPSA